MKLHYRIFLFCLLLVPPLIHATPMKFSVSGVTGDIKENVEKRLNTLGRSSSTLQNQADAMNVYRQGIKEIKKAVAPFGYFKATVQGQLTYKTLWQAQYHVTLNRVIRIHRVNVTLSGAGKNDPAFVHLLKHLPIKTGQPFKTKSFEQSKAAFTSIAAQQGYFDAKLTKSVLIIDLKRYQVSAEFHFYTGRQYRFGTIQFSKNPYHDSFLRRYLTLQSARPYSSKKLTESENNLQQSHLFSSVALDSFVDRKTYTVPVHVKLKPAPKRRYRLGVGYGTDTGFRGLLGLEMNQITPNGHRFLLNLHPSQIASYGSADYIIPGANPITDQHKFSVITAHESQTRPSLSKNQRKRDRTGREEKQSITYSYQTMLPNRWQQTLGLTMLYARYNNTGQPKQNTHFLMPSALWMRKVIDNPLHPNQGYRISLLMRGASQSINATHSFFQVRTDAKVLQPINSNNRFALRGAIGYTEIDSIFNLPLSLQFLEGGANSIRGYGYQSIGPGKALLTGSVELQHQFKENWYLIAYYDAGDVNERFKSLHMKQGIGAGIHWESPVGGIELSVASPLAKNSRSLRLVFTMGPEL